MTLYLRETRRCKDCEYYRKDIDWQPGNCYFNPPASGAQQTDRFPHVNEDGFCSKWEPIWHKNPILWDAWKEFVLVRKLITSGEENEKT